MITQELKDLVASWSIPLNHSDKLLKKEICNLLIKLGYLNIAKKLDGRLYQYQRVFRTHINSNNETWLETEENYYSKIGKKNKSNSSFYKE